MESHEDVLDKSIMDFDDNIDTDVKIRPNAYIHYSIVNAQKALIYSLMKSNITEGFLAFNTIIEQLEALCDAAGYLPKDYEADIKKYKESEDYKNIEKKDIQAARLSNTKYRILLTAIFKRAPLDTPMRA